jgi:HPt (histidine-containing phosphotransfer) domain-containing protein
MSAMSVRSLQTPRASSASRSLEPALDLVHLERQTDGDLALQQELLTLFDRQSASLLALSGSRAAAKRERADAAHKLRGSALVVGAGAVARAAAAVEAVFADAAMSPEALETALAGLGVAVEAARAALARLRD